MEIKKLQMNLEEDLGCNMSQVEKNKNIEIEQAEDNISVQAKIVRDLVREFNQTAFLKTKLHDSRRGESDFDKEFKYPNHLELTKFYMEKFNMELLQVKNSNNKWVVMQLHGGGYVGTYKNSYRKFAGLYTELGKGLSVLSLDYRVAPENPYPAALEDAITAYDWLIERGYKEKNIILAGDSAGGGLAMALCHYLKDNNRNLPGGIIAMSPWTDVTASGESYTDNYEIDPIFGNTKESLIYNNPYPKDEDPAQPYISPVNGNFEGFPPMLIQVGTYEMLLSDSRNVVKKAKEAGCRIRYTEYEGMFHVFQMALTMVPESKRAWSEVGKFIETLMEE